MESELFRLKADGGRSKRRKTLGVKGTEGLTRARGGTVLGTGSHAETEITLASDGDSYKLPCNLLRILGS